MVRCDPNFELTGMVRILYFETTDVVLEEKSEAAEVGVSTDAGDFFVLQLFDWNTSAS